MSDLDDLCEKVNCARVKHRWNKNETNCGSGLKRQFKLGLRKNGDWANVWHMSSHSDDGERVNIKINCTKFDKHGDKI